MGTSFIGHLSWRPVTIGTPKYVRPTRMVSRLKSYLRVPAFTIDTHQLTDVGASFIAGVFNLATVIPFNFAFVTPIIKNSRYDQFVPAIKWTVGSTVLRYKLVEDYGEDFDYPLYAGETIPVTGAPQLEIWTCPTMLVSKGGLVICSAAFDLTISEVSVPVDCSQTAGTQYDPTICSIFLSAYPPASLSQYFTTCAP